ncbi:MAG: hypothetical protein V4481_01500 [Patescibacteria group bacterium]
MNTIRYDQKVVPSPGTFVGTGTSEGSHAVYDHLHFDIQGTDGDVLAKVQQFVDQRNQSAGKQVLTWQNFKRVGFQDVMEVWKRSDYPVDERLAQILSDPTLFGAPTAHLTAKFTGVPIGEDHDKFLYLYQKGVEIVEQLGSTGYIEGERVSFRVEMRNGKLDLNRTPSLCPVRSVEKVTLASIGRKFRTTEIHISFDRIDQVHPALLTDIFSQGFYTAFRQDEKTGNYSVIATIQGFEREILLIAAKMHNWLVAEVQNGGIGCPAVIKKEDITRYCVFGQGPKLQMVVRPEFW